MGNCVKVETKENYDAEIGESPLFSVACFAQKLGKDGGELEAINGQGEEKKELDNDDLLNIINI